MIKWLAGSYPDLWAKLDVLSIEVYALDCTFSARMPNEQTALQVIQFMRGVSNGQGLPLSLRQRLLRQLEGLRLYTSYSLAFAFVLQEQPRAFHSRGSYNSDHQCPLDHQVSSVPAWLRSGQGPPSLMVDSCLMVRISDHFLISQSAGLSPLTRSLQAT